MQGYTLNFSHSNCLKAFFLVFQCAFPGMIQKRFSSQDAGQRRIRDVPLDSETKDIYIIFPV